MFPPELIYYLVSSVLFYTVAAHLLATDILPEHTAVFAVSLGASLSWLVHAAFVGWAKKNEEKTSEATTAHFICSGLLLGFSRFFEFASLARVHPIIHESTWTLIPFFYILAAESWKELRFEYRHTRITLGLLVLCGMALIFTAVGNRVLERFGLVYAILWIVTKAYYIVYTHYIRLALGGDPGRIHLWSNVAATGK
jgi:drug/metabolite transporter (DMT)-like permease